MPPKVKYSIQHVEAAIKRFKIDDLKEHVLPVFPEVAWAEVRGSIVKEKLALNKKNLAKVVSKVFGQSKPAENDIKMKICSLKLVEVSTYPSRRLWSTHQLSQRENRHSLDNDPDELDAVLGRTLRGAGIKGMRQVTVHDGVYWIMILPTKKNKRTMEVTMQAPSFYSYTPSSPYLFSARKKGLQNDAHINVLSAALGYKKVKALALEGPDLKALLQMLKHKEQQAVDDSTRPMQLDDPELPPPYVTVEEGNVAVSNSRSRREYAEKIFGKNPPALKTMTLHASKLAPVNEIWGDDPLDVKITIRAPNVFNCLTDLTECRVINAPFSQYMHGIMKRGKNVIQLKEQA